MNIVEIQRFNLPSSFYFVVVKMFMIYFTLSMWFTFLFKI
jgi:hypothetical protein